MPWTPADLRRTLQNAFQIGKGGVQLFNEAGSLTIKNANGTIDAPLRASTITNSGTRIAIPGTVQVLVASNQIQPTSETVQISSASAIALTSSPVILPGVAGQKITVYNSGSFNITLPANGVSFLQGLPSLTIPAGQVVLFCFLGGSWRQINTVTPVGSATCRCNSSSAIALPSGAFTTLSFNNNRWDTDNIHSTTVNPSRLVCRTPGVYLIQASLSFSSNLLGRRDARLMINGAAITSEGRPAVADAKTPLPVLNSTSISISGSWLMNAGDYAEVAAYQDSGIAMGIVIDGQSSPEFSMSRIS